jgi:hypothetical protein
LSRFGWNDLPDEIRTAVQDNIGPVLSSSDVGAGQNNDLAIKLERAAQPAVFLKGVRGGGRRGTFLENEINAGQLTAGIAPAVLCHAEQANWQVVAFEFVAGRPVDLSPGSADLEHVGHTIDALGKVSPGETQPLRQRWTNPNHWRNVAGRAPDIACTWDIDEMCRWSARAPELVDGDRLLHTDLHRDQILITDDARIFVIDWAFPAAGAAWVDAAYLSLRLTASGHTHADAIRWLRERASWYSDTLVEPLTAWAVFVAGLWSWFAVQDNALDGAIRRAQTARDYATWCLRNLKLGPEVRR